MKTLTTEEMNRLNDLLASLEQAKKDKRETESIKEKIMNFMRENKMKSFKYNNIVMRLSDERTTVAFDIDLLRQDYPEIFEKCHSTQVRPAHLSIKRVGGKVADEKPTDEELMETLS